MRILLVKTSSLGDVIHNLPVVSDLRRSFPDAASTGASRSLRRHSAPAPGVDQVIPVAIRRWRKHLAGRDLARNCATSGSASRARTYDAVLDTQGSSRAP
jgi:heptosyltransferase-1